MMKIGILTFHRSINNGAVMQCYSLSKKIQQEFPDDVVEVIDYHMPLVDNTVYNTSFSHYFREGGIKHKIGVLLSLPKTLQSLKQKEIRKKTFEAAIQNLPLSKDSIYQNTISELNEYINKSYDIVIAGSDAIWNYNLRGFPNPYFLDKNIICNKLSYAASCYGMNYEKIPSEQKEQIQEILNSYTFLGTRDNESDIFLKHIGCTLTPVHTCDPTIFLDVDDLPIDVPALKNKLVAKGFDFSRRTIGVMGSEDMCKMIRRMFGRKYQLVSLYNYNELCDVNLNDLSPYEWAYVFRLFNVTITTYFHGTLLSLRNGVPVVCIALQTDYSKYHETKVHDVLRRLNLLDFYFETDYKKKNVASIKNKIQTSIESNLRDMILSRVNKESESFKPFLECLKHLHSI